MTLKEFLIEEKQKWLQMERASLGVVKDVMAAQIRMADAILIFLASQQTEADMAKLRLTLERRPLSLEDLKPREENKELTEALVELAAELRPGEEYPLNSLPVGTNPKSVSAKIYALRADGKIPQNIYPAP